MTHIEFMASQEQRIEDAWQDRQLPNRIIPIKDLNRIQMSPLVFRTIKAAEAADRDERNRRQLRSDLSEAEKAEALRIGRIEFASAGAVRKR